MLSPKWMTKLKPRMRNLLLNNWATKITTLLVAIAIWYLVNSSERQGPINIPIPGTDTGPVQGNPPINPLPPLDSTKTGSILTSPIPGADTTTPKPPAQ